MKKIVPLAILLLMSTKPVLAKIYIDITETSKNPFSLAITESVTKSEADKTDSSINVFNKTLQKDLEFLSLFKFIDRSAHLDSSNRTFAAKEIDFAKWAVLDAMGLVKSWYTVENGKITVQAHLFDILSRSEIIAKKYQGNSDQVKDMAHSFADAILKALTGTDGIFKSKIAYVCAPNRDRELCVISLDGETKDQLTRSGALVRSPAWNAKGTSVFFTLQKNGQNPQPYRADIDSKTIDPLSPVSGIFNGMAVSPSGNLLTSLTKDGNAELYTTSATGNSLQRLTVSPDIDVSGKYFPDGKKIAFVSDRGNGTHIYSMNADGSNVKQLTFKGKRNESPAVSPKGDKIILAGMDTDRHYDIFSMDVDGSDLIRLTNDANDNESPAWSPGGELIVFSSNRSGQYQLWTMRPDGSNQRQLTTERYEHKMPAWSPNAR